MKSGFDSRKTVTKILNSRINFATMGRAPSVRDLDGDGISNKIDCNPLNFMYQDRITNVPGNWGKIWTNRKWVRIDGAEWISNTMKSQLKGRVRLYEKILSGRKNAYVLAKAIGLGTYPKWDTTYWEQNRENLGTTYNRENIKSYGIITEDELKVIVQL